ncbi:MAG TPA: hypothetical protein DHV62_04700, partial [Elusimicrobia bacterium]|nr:hypothetical protein [Elusimicrobiota bacterium]
MNTDKEKNSFHSDVLVNGFTQFARVVLQLLISILLARSLGPQGRGEYALALRVPGLIYIFVHLGFSQATTILLGKNKYPKEKIVGNLLFCIFLICFLTAIIYYGLASIVLNFLKQNINRSLYYLSFFVIPVTFFWAGLSAILLGLGIVKTIGWGRLLNNALFLLLCFVVFLFWGKIPFITLVIFLFTGIVEIFYLIFVIRKHMLLSFSFDFKIIKEQFNFGIKSLFTGIFEQVNRRLDALLVNFFLGTYGLGIYTISVGLGEALINVPSIFYQPVFSRTAVLQNEEGFRITAITLRQILFLTSISAILFAIFVKPFIFLFYSSRFAEAVLPTVFLLPGIVSVGIGTTIGYSLTGYGKPEEYTKASIVSCILTVILDLFLIPKFGVAGASVASSIAYTAGTIYLIRSYSKFSGQSLKEMFLFRREDFKGYL